MSETHWTRQADQWGLLGQPLLPGAEDIAAFEHYASLAAADIASPDALVLGVTREIMGMNWPPRSRVTGCDRLLKMILRRRPSGADRAVCADWLHLPFVERSHDIVVGDNSLNVLSGGAVVGALVTEIARVLRPGGWLVLRLSVRPEKQESVAEIMDDLKGGRIGSFHAFKWRLAMALHDRIETGVRLANIWDAWHAEVPEPDALVRDLGWDPTVLKTIDVYRDVQSRYTFPTMAEAREIFSRSFEERSHRIGGYELGDRCPVVSLMRR